jgi:hypothetical protein
VGTTSAMTNLLCGDGDTKSAMLLVCDRPPAAA